MNAFNISTWDNGIPVNLMPALSTEWKPGQPKLHRQFLSGKTNKQKTLRRDKRSLLYPFMCTKVYKSIPYLRSLFPPLLVQQRLVNENSCRFHRPRVCTKRTAQTISFLAPTSIDLPFYHRPPRDTQSISIFFVLVHTKKYCFEAGKLFQWVWTLTIFLWTPTCIWFLNTHVKDKHGWECS